MGHSWGSCLWHARPSPHSGCLGSSPCEGVENQLDRLIASLPRRIQGCIDANGGRTLLKMVSRVLKCLKFALAVYILQHLFSTCLTFCEQYREVGMDFQDALLNFV